MKTDLEIFDQQINPLRDVILRRHPDVSPIEMKAFAGFCFHLGVEYGYDLGQRHAKKGIDDRRSMKDFDWESFSFRKKQKQKTKKEKNK